jgi:phosphatidylethanolamine/phosphatidyl-N-methylethanolamine N-methyltransferase
MTPSATGGTLADMLKFLRSLVAHPKNIGAIAPSSGNLGRVIAAQTDPQLPGPVLELGPGTGVVTNALLDRGFAPERIIAIEYDPDLARLVSQRFPRVRVIRGDAFDLERTLGSHEPFSAVVSSLPLLNFSPAQRTELIAQAFALASPGAPFIQFSYGLAPPVPGSESVSVRRAAFVLLNLPPARVWVYTARQGD